MKRLGLLLLAVLAVFSLSGCISLTGKSSIDTTNDLIAETNKGRLESFATAMSKCGANSGCQVAVSMAFASNMGQQAFLRPETTLDYIREIRQWVDPVGNLIDRFNGGSGGAGGQGFVLNDSNNNTFIGFNRTSLKGEGSINSPFDATNSVDRTQSWENMYNPINDRSVTDTK